MDCRAPAAPPEWVLEASSRIIIFIIYKVNGMQNAYKSIFLKNLGVFILIHALYGSDCFNAIKYCFKSIAWSINDSSDQKLYKIILILKVVTLCAAVHSIILLIINTI